METNIGEPFQRGARRNALEGGFTCYSLYIYNTFSNLVFSTVIFFAVGDVNGQHEKTCNWRKNIWEKTGHIENWERLKVIDGIFQDILNNPLVMSK